MLEQCQKWTLTLTISPTVTHLTKPLFFHIRHIVARSKNRRVIEIMLKMKNRTVSLLYYDLPTQNSSLFRILRHFLSSGLCTGTLLCFFFLDQGLLYPSGGGSLIARADQQRKMCEPNLVICAERKHLVRHNTLEINFPAKKKTKKKTKK